MRISLLYRDAGAPVDGIRDYTRQLSQALASRGQDVSVELLDRSRIPPEVEDADALIVQYNPFSYGRWGVAPWLPSAIRRLKHKRHGPLVAIMVHEPYMPLSDWRATLMGGWQRIQMLALRSAADVTFVSIEPWLDTIRRWGPRNGVYHVPVGSTLPDMRAHRNEARSEFGVDDATTVVAAFGTGHPSRLMSHVGAAVIALHEAGHKVVLFNLGAGAPPPEGVPRGVRVETPGQLERSAVARLLSAADLFTAPFIDGVSSRRTTFIAALQHGIPTVATLGSLTDVFIRDAGACRLVPTGDRDAFARAVVELAESRAERDKLARGARLLYEQRFAWPVLADRVLTLLGDARSNGRC
jgi:glycosyltransferase involved in cell wall biosynthesis